MIRNRATPEGREIGARMAKFCDDEEPKARLRFPELPPRCNSCAFRQGDHVANGSPETQMDALKCVMEGREFYCHEPAREGMLCMGWACLCWQKRILTSGRSFGLSPTSPIRQSCDPDEPSPTRPRMRQQLQ
jgi:hypothetical protein